MTRWNAITRAATGLMLLALGCGNARERSEASAASLAPLAAEGASAPSEGQHPGVAAASTAEKSLTRVTDTSLVCMVNNQFMGRPQIPVQVDGQTYFGCCEMCKGRLTTDPSSRSASDPVSQRPVDKASAIIGRASDGAVLYFESEGTFAAYLAQHAPQQQHGQ